MPASKAARWMMLIYTPSTFAAIFSVGWGVFFVNYLSGQPSVLKYREETAATGGNIK